MTLWFLELNSYKFSAGSTPKVSIACFFLKQSNCEVIYEYGTTDKVFNKVFLLDKLENKTKSCIIIDTNNINEIIAK